MLSKVKRGVAEPGNPPVIAMVRVAPGVVRSLVVRKVFVFKAVGRVVTGLAVAGPILIWRTVNVVLFKRLPNCPVVAGSPPGKSFAWPELKACKLKEEPSPSLLR